MSGSPQSHEAMNLLWFKNVDLFCLAYYYRLKKQPSTSHLRWVVEEGDKVGLSRPYYLLDLSYLDFTGLTGVKYGCFHIKSFCI